MCLQLYFPNDVGNRCPGGGVFCPFVLFQIDEFCRSSEIAHHKRGAFRQALQVAGAEGEPGKDVRERVGQGVAIDGAKGHVAVKPAPKRGVYRFHAVGARDEYAVVVLYLLQKLGYLRVLPRTLRA